MNHLPTTGQLTVAGCPIGPGHPLAVVAGPCVIESEDQTLRVAHALADIAQRHHLHLIFKASWDKANRTRPSSFRGPGLDRGLEILTRVRAQTGLPVTTDVHSPEQVPQVSGAVDLLQIPAFLCRQTDLLFAAAASGVPVNVKKGQFMAPQHVRWILEKLHGARGVMITERGTCFGHGDLVVDYRGLPQMRELGVPVCFDATHSTQRPSEAGGVSGGDRHLAPVLARAAVAVGVDAVFFEVHGDPAAARSDAHSQVHLDHFEKILRSLFQLRAAVDQSAAKP